MVNLLLPLVSLLEVNMDVEKNYCEDNNIILLIYPYNYINKLDSVLKYDINCINNEKVEDCLGFRSGSF